ncbi:MAG: hypothetical protein HYR84_10075 [Planctomycetes bacterium]|nr:hypothetical protein [Planctomycetota bacterium]
MADADRDPLDVVIADLRGYFEDNLPVELWQSDEREPARGFIAAIEANYVVIARLSQAAWLNGFLAMRFTEISEVLPLDDADENFVIRAMEAQGEAIPPRLPMRAATLEGLLAIICAYFPMIVVEYRDGAELTDAGGTILCVDGGVATLRLLSRQGTWIDEEHGLDLSQVTQVWFGSRYERVLERIGAFLDERTRRAAPQMDR